MAYSERGRSQRPGPAPSGGRQRISGPGPYHGPRGTRSRGNSAVGSKIGGNRGRGGYPVKSRNINFQGGRGRNRVLGMDRQMLILGALAVVLIVLVVVGVSSCVRGCTPAEKKPDETQVNSVDGRVAAGVSEDLTKRFTPELDQADALDKIAKNADKYTDSALIDLALSTPEAREFVAAYPDAEKTAQAYGDYSGTGAPTLYDWDARWGNVDYAGHALAVTGSGPTALAMARIGLLGDVSQTPATIATAVATAGAATGDSFMAASYLDTAGDALGLKISSQASNADNLSYVLDAGTYLLIEAKAGTLTDTAHWVLLVTENSDGSVVVYDPTSPSVTAHPWSPATLAASCDTLYALSKADTGTTDGKTTQQ